MSDPNVTPELRKTLIEVLEETTSGFTTHPDPDHLFAYSGGTLSAREEEALREHLSLCRECLDRLQLDPEDPAAEHREGVVDLEARRAWREVEAHLREFRARRDLERQRTHSRFYQVAAAIFLVVAAGMAWRPLTGPDETTGVATVARGSGPVVNAGIFDVMRSRVRSVAESSQDADASPLSTALEVAQGVDAFTLIFLLESGDYDTYELKILDSERKVLWATREILVMDDRATLSLSRGDLNDGEYSFEIYCWRDGEARVWEYPIRLVYL